MRIRRLILGVGVWGFLIAVPSVAKAQHKPFWEAGVLGGFSAYRGDLTEGLVDAQEVYPAGGLFLRYHASPSFVVKANVYYGTIGGNDAHAKDAGRRMRNLSFKSSLLDIAVTGELNLVPFSPLFQKRYSSFAPYLFLGLNIFRFNPKAFYGGQWVPLQPLGTEGQGTLYYSDRRPYGLTQVAVPFGVGVRAALSRNIGIGFELGARKTFTDYLDDVSSTYPEKEILLAERGELAWELSVRKDEYLGEEVIPAPGEPRGDPTNKDWYFISGISVSYFFIRNYCNWGN